MLAAPTASASTTCSSSPSTSTRSSAGWCKRAAEQGRSDDTEDVIRRRLEVYFEQTAPLTRDLRGQGLLVRVDGLGAVDEVTGADRGRPRHRAVAHRPMFRRKSSIEIKTPDQLAVMRQAGLVVAQALAAIADAAAPGVTTGDLDAIARDVLADHGATSSFLGYGARRVPYPGVICASVNDEVVHGIPGDRVLRDGDLLSIDFGAIVDGWHGDAAISVLVGDVAPEVAELSRVTEASLWAGLAAARAGAHLTDISHAVETTIVAAQARSTASSRSTAATASAPGCTWTRTSSTTAAPAVAPSCGRGWRWRSSRWSPWAARRSGVLEDDWTVVTLDGSCAAHWEHTVAITEDGPWVLTALDDVRL